MKIQLRLILYAALFVSFTSFACRYSVRDTGFVDLGEDNYRLILSGNELEAHAVLYRTISAASLLDANISFEVREDSKSGVPTLTLEDSDGRKLVLARGEALPTVATEASTLMESVALSPLRAEIHEKALDAFAVVVLVDGGNEADNLRVQTSIEAAIKTVTRLMPSMPKPVDTPPALIRVTSEQLAKERVTLWGLGIDPVPSDEPRVAMVFGRGRRIGSPLEGPLITQTAMEQHLVIIGQDCECELDREWMKGPLLPARWDADRQRQAVQNLGFDPENPLVRAEVSRIVLRGPGTGKFKKLAGSSSSLGYSEISLEEIPLDLPSEQPVMAAVPEVPPAPVAADEPVEPTLETIASASPLEQTRSATWFIVVGGAFCVVIVAAIWWRKIRREQG